MTDLDRLLRLGVLFSTKLPTEYDYISLTDEYRSLYEKLKKIDLQQKTPLDVEKLERIDDLLSECGIVDLEVFISEFNKLEKDSKTNADKLEKIKEFMNKYDEDKFYSWEDFKSDFKSILENKD